MRTQLRFKICPLKKSYIDHKSILIYLEEIQVEGQSASTYWVILYAKDCTQLKESGKQKWDTVLALLFILAVGKK